MQWQVQYNNSTVNSEILTYFKVDENKLVVTVLKITFPLNYSKIKREKHILKVLCNYFLIKFIAYNIIKDKVK